MVVGFFYKEKENRNEEREMGMKNVARYLQGDGQKQKTINI